MRHHPYSWRPRVGRSPLPLPRRTEGARDAKGPGGPTGLDASRHRGLSKSVLPQVRLTQGVPRAVFIGLLHAVPGGRPFVTLPRLGAATLHRWGHATRPEMR